MKFVKYGLGGLAALVAAVLVVGFMLPKSVHIERSTVVDAEPCRVYPLVSDLQAMNKWSPWAGRDPNTRWTWSEQTNVVGAEMSWTSDSPDVGSGKQTITRLEECKRVETALDFGGQGAADAFIALAPEGDKTRVTWGFDSDLDPPIGTYFGLVLENWLGPDYEQGLAKLADVVAELPPPAPPAPPAPAPAADAPDGEQTAEGDLAGG